MKDIGEFSTEELQEEIERRKTIMVRKPMLFLDSTKMDEFIVSLDKLVDAWAGYGKEEYDANSVFGALMSTLYGNDFLDWYEGLPKRS